MIIPNIKTMPLPFLKGILYSHYMH